jgi:uncharacterized cupin superfamily protein
VSEKKEAESSRSRFGNVAHEDTVEERRYEHPGGRFEAGHRAISRVLGSKALGFGIVSLDPGKATCPFHFHHLEEEMFYVLAGKGILRQGDEDGEERIELGRGDFVSFPAGTGISHQFINESDEPFVYLALSNIVEGDVCEYPDSDKVLFRKTRLVVKRTPKLDYFDGEV